MIILLTIFLTFLSGVLVGDIWFQSGVWIIGLLIAIIFAFRWARWWMPIVCIILLLGGYSLSYLTLVHFEEKREFMGDMVGWDGHDRTISGVAGKLISTSEFSHKYRVTISTIDEKPIEPFDVSLSLPPNLSLTSGDHVVALGRFNFPRDTPEYLAEKQLWNQGLIAEFRGFNIEKTPPERYSIFVRLRNIFDQKLDEIFPQEGHDLLSGIILGQKTNLAGELKNNLKASGLMHLMVVSGSNVMMLIIFLTLFLRAFTPWIRIGIIAVTILGFVILVGGDIPVWRAALMGVIGYSASLWGWRFSPLILPLFVASILAVVNPLSIAYDIGLQLSFLSVNCIIAFGKKITKFFSFLGAFFDEAMSLTIAATLGTFPITLFYFGTFSLVSPIANLFAAPAIPVLMSTGIVTLILSIFSDTAAYFFGYIPWIAVTYLMKVITIFGSTKWSLINFDLGSSRAEFMVAAMAILVFGILKTVKISKRVQEGT